MGNVVSLIRVTALLAAISAPAHADVFLTFRPTVTAGVGVSPEGCLLEPGPAVGTMGGPGPYNYQHECHSGVLGYADQSHIVGQIPAVPSTFTSSPFENGLELTGLASVHVHYVLNTVAAAGIGAPMTYVLYDVSPLGIATIISEGVAIKALRHDGSVGYAGQTGSFDVNRYRRGPYHLAPGHQLRLALMTYGFWVTAAHGRLLFGGQPISQEIPALGIAMPRHGFEDAGLFLATR